MSLVYHGSDTVIKRPQVLRAGYGKDFGYGFYVTRIKSQDQKWAQRKSIISPVVSVYELDPAYIECAYKGFNNCEDDAWVDFIAGCRNGIPHSYDIVEGPMADDQVWNFVDDYIAHRIPREVFKV